MNIINTRSFLILTAILVFGVLVTIGLVSQSTSDTKSIKLARANSPPSFQFRCESDM